MSNANHEIIINESIVAPLQYSFKKPNADKNTIKIKTRAVPLFAFIMIALTAILTGCNFFVNPEFDGKLKTVTPPTVAITTFVYDGSEKKLTLSNFNPSVTTVTGNSGKEIGTYICIIMLRDKTTHEWADGTQDDIHIEWEILNGSVI